MSREGRRSETSYSPSEKPQHKEKGRLRQELALSSSMVWPKLDGSSTAEEVEQNGNYGKYQQDVDEPAGNVKSSESEQP
jgi:hypothetical protein